MFSYYYHGHTRTAISVFGSLFNNIKIARADSSGKINQFIPVPIQYGPTDKALADQKLKDQAETKVYKKWMETFPRMTFELSSIGYNSSNQNNVLQSQINRKVADPDYGSIIMSPAKYNLDFNLYIMAKSQNDALQIVEQILPYFRPSLTVKVKNDILNEDPLSFCYKLNTVTFEDNYDDAFENTRVVRYTISFVLEIPYYGPSYKDIQSAIQEAASNGNVIDNTNYLEIKIHDDNTVPLIQKAIIYYDTEL